MGLFQNRRKANADAAVSVNETVSVEDTEDVSNAAEIWNAAQAQVDETPGLDGHESVAPPPLTPERRAEDIAIPPPPPVAPAPPETADPDPFAAPSAFDMLTRPLTPPPPPDAANRDHAGATPEANPWIAPTPPMPEPPPFAPPGGFIDLSEAVAPPEPTTSPADLPSTDIADSAAGLDSVVTSDSPAAHHGVGDESLFWELPGGTVEDSASWETPDPEPRSAPSLDRDGLFELLEIDDAASLDEVAMAYRAFVTDHVAGDDIDAQTAALLQHVHREVNSAYAQFRLSHAPD